MIPFNLHGKHRDRREFKHPGEVHTSQELSQSDQFPDGVFLAQKDRKEIMNMMKGQWEQYSFESNGRPAVNPFEKLKEWRTFLDRKSVV